MEKYKLNRLKTQNYKNLSLQDGLPLNNLNIFIGPNGSGKSNLTDIFKFLLACTTDPPDETRGTTRFEDAVFRLGGPRILTGNVTAPAKVGLEFEFESIPAKSSYHTLEIELSVQDASSPITISRELLTSRQPNTSQEPFYYYKCHDRTSNSGVISVYNDPAQPKQTHFEPLAKIPANDLALVTIPELLETSKFPPENTPVYRIRRHLIDTISHWRFYNANDMNLQEIRLSEPKIGQRDIHLSRSGKNLSLVLHNLIRNSLDFEETINNAMKAILPNTRRLRAIPSGRLSLTVEWFLENIAEPFYLNEVSDGTVRMLCWATILHAPQLPTLVVIDEPEIGIHVAWMPILAEWIKAASQKTQIIICTHSPDLLDHFTDQVENTLVFNFAESKQNLFQVQPLTEAQVAGWLADGWQLGDLYRVGNPNLGGWPW